MTATLPDLDLDVNLDLVAQCTVVIRKGRPDDRRCPDPAEWRLCCRCLSCGCKVYDLVCTPHKDLIAAAERSRRILYECGRCHGGNVTVESVRAI
jgi:hypothetical protein